MQNNTFSGLIIGKSVITLNRVASTNDYFKENLSKFTPQDEGSAIIAVEQFAGKGQRGNTWLSEPGKNITTSILLFPNFLAIQDQFYLACAVSLGIFKFIESKTDQKVHIKWPNDIYVNRKKIAGVLIENTIKGKQLGSSIIGVGINVYQINFEGQEHATSLTSLSTLPLNQNITELTKELYQFLDKEYKELANGNYQALLEAYNEKLFRKNEVKPYLVNNTPIMGRIMQVNAQGLLQVEIGNELKEFSLQEIRYLR